MVETCEPSIVNVISQNVLHDVGRTEGKLILPQDARIPSLAATLQAFPGSLDVVGIQEAYKSPDQHNGEMLAEACGYGPGFWVEHNQKRKENPGRGRTGEHMGLFGAMVEYAESINLGDNRQAVITVIDGIAYATLHLRSGRKARYDRYLQARNFTEATKEYENLVAFGDFNEPPIPVRSIAMARAELARTGLRSVYPLTGQKRPITSPIPSYKQAAMNGRSRLEARFVERGWPIDDILVRGPRIRVLAAGVLERVIVPSTDEIPEGVPLEGSDHDGAWATLAIAA